MIARGHFSTATALHEAASLQAEHQLEVRRLSHLPEDEHGRVHARLVRLLPDDLAEGLNELFLEVRLALRAPVKLVNEASEPQESVASPQAIAAPPSEEAPISEAEMRFMDFLVGRALAAIFAEQRGASAAHRSERDNPSDTETK